MKVLFVAAILAGLVLAGPAFSQPDSCPVTAPNDYFPPGELWHHHGYGHDRLATHLWDGGTIAFRPGGPGFVLADGALQMKFGWWRGGVGALTISGRRLDAPAPPLRARIPPGYGDSGFQSTGLTFPTPGCWEVTGRVGDDTLTFVTRVVKIGDGPAGRAE